VDPDGCYAVTFVDSFGDGIAFPGYFEVYFAGNIADRGGSFANFVQVLHVGDGCGPLDPLLSCADGAIDSRRVHEPTESWFAGVSEIEFQGNPFMRAENFTGLAGPICGVRWWGTYAVFAFDIEPCSEFTPEFDIIVYDDVDGGPGNARCSYTATIEGLPTGQFYLDTFELLRFDLELPTCCNVRDGWISVRGKGDPFCVFLWVSSPYDDGITFVWNDDDAYYEPGDLSYCFTSTTTPGACCNPFDASCTDNVAPPDCTSGFGFTPGVACADLDPVCGGVPGACCDDTTTACEDNVLPANCAGRHSPGVFCADLDPACGDAPGACCYPDGRDCAQVSLPVCTATGGAWHGVGSDCGICPCIVACPPGAIPEQDACGEDTNNGCNGFPPAFQDISVGDTICGTGSAEGDRDTDWYRFAITEPSVITVAFEGEFGERVIFGGIMEYPLNRTGSGDCADISGAVNPVFNVAECEPGVAITECLPAGTYFAFVSPVNFEGFPCGADNDYVVSVTAEPCTLATGACCRRDGSCGETDIYTCAAAGDVYQGDDTSCVNTECRQPEPGDRCDLPRVITLPAEIPFVEHDTTCGRFNDHDATCLATYDGGEDIVYQLNVTAPTSVHITVDPFETNFTGLVLDSTCPPGATCRWTDTTDAARVMDLGCRTFEPGAYYLMADTWPFPECIPDFEISLTPCTPTPGACCSASLSCLGTATSEEQCLDTLGGVKWYEGTECGSFTCPPPAADFCESATRIDALPFVHAGIDAPDLSDDENVDPPCDSPFSCGESPANNGWWYTLIPRSDCTLSIEVAQIDSAISVWTGTDCANLVPAGCSDPEFTEVALTGGAHYWVLVSNWSCFSEPSNTADVTLGGSCAFACGDFAPAGGDGVVGMDDYQVFLASFGRCAGSDGFLAAADFDHDGCVTWVDYQSWLTCYRDAVTVPTVVSPGGRKPSAVGRAQGDAAEVEHSGPVARPAP
jgi:hypothetical protein